MNPYNTVLALLMSIVISLSASAQELDSYGGTDIKGKKTGFFHTQRIDDRWWLVTPEGHGFFGIGLSHPVTGFSKGTVTYSYNGSRKPGYATASRRCGSWDTTVSGAALTARNVHVLATSSRG